MSTKNVIINFIVTSAAYHFRYDSIRFNKLRYDTYDFIVIACGSAGTLVAAEVSRFKVLLLDRGGNSGNYFAQIPYIASFIGYDSRFVMEFPSVKQNYACGNTDGIRTLSAGLGLGDGTSFGTRN